MKKLLGLLVLVSSVSAFASDERVMEVSCHDARIGLGDTGYSLSISSGGFTGMTLGTLSEQTFVAPRVLKTVTLTSSRESMNQVYRGKGMKLVITMESFAPTKIHPATLALNYSDRKVVVQMNCKVLR